MSVEKVKALFVEDLRSLLNFEQHGNCVVIKPRTFLGSENFAEISRVVTANGGEWISAGKESHFRIPIASSEPAQAQPPRENLHFAVTKLTVEMGRTVQQSETEWSKRSYALELEVKSDVRDVVEKAKAEAEQLVDSWLSEPEPPVFIPHIDLAELDACPWQTYRTKEPAKPGQTAWIKNPVEFTSWKDPPNVLLQLVKALKRSPDEKLVLGKMEYSFSGDKKQFIGRKPVK